MPLYAKLLHDAMMAELSAITPIILLLLAIGFATAIIQSALQIEDTAFSLLPKTIAMIGIAMFGGFGALHIFTAFALSWIGHAGSLVHQSWS